ncbi:MAG TPA: FmdE family protein [Candidimonas sp.]|nr:FmdE family protein [Candidimonas sp.]
MSHPSFFDNAIKITLYDPLAEMLGASEKGLIEYSYTDVVKLAGHSCPTVAGAYLMSVKALGHLYGDSIAQRGDIKVDFQDDQLNGVTGVIANVVGFITGATVDNGFKGLAGQYDRRNLLSFNAPIDGDIQFQRRDTGAKVTVSFNAGVVPAPPTLMPTLQRILVGSATREERDDFGKAWQERVRQILENADHPELVTFA